MKSIVRLKVVCSDQGVGWSLTIDLGMESVSLFKMNTLIPWAVDHNDIDPLKGRYNIGFWLILFLYFFHEIYHKLTCESASKLVLTLKK